MKKQNFKTLFLTLSLIALMNTSFAKNADRWQGKGRIAISSDGNKHDNDDIAATALTLMILAKQRLQNNVVLYTYADHIWGSENDDLSKITESAEGGGSRFGYTNTQFIAAVSNPNAAYNAMANAIAVSTEDNPLFIIAAGPMQVIGKAFDIANRRNPNALNFVTVISHSDWNERHADHPENGHPHGWEPPHSGWTWNEMKNTFGSKVNFNHIKDQNGTGSKPYETKDKFSAKNWGVVDWMKTHNDPNVQWVYQRGKVAGPPDYSDAGIAWYFLTGDEFGNFNKLRNWVGTNNIPTRGKQRNSANRSHSNTKARSIANIDKGVEKTSGVYPNPVKDNLEVKTKQPIKKLIFINSSGVPVFKQEVNSSNITINISKYPKGAYLLKTQMQNDKWTTYKIIKE